MTGPVGRDLPEPLAALHELALDLRWTWSHGGDALWREIDEDAWERTQNPWIILQATPAARLLELAADSRFLAELARVAAARREDLTRASWYQAAHPDAPLTGVGFFSMEFGLGEALPLYAGGLGILAGDFLKTASDLGVPCIGIGLLYQEGYFRQMIDAACEQQEAYPYNDPTTLPIEPVLAADGARAHVKLALPGRELRVRIWKAPVGRSSIYLLDSNDPTNQPLDRGITGKLYGGGTELRLLQELLLGVGGWRAIRAFAPGVEIAHLNEGHAAFVVVERARERMAEAGVSFQEALWATRPGNVFTTHTPVAAGFDRFPAALVERYLAAMLDGAPGSALATEVLALGRADPSDAAEPFNMAYLAMRGAQCRFGVSRLHGAVSRDIFQPLYPRWPHWEVPVGHVTNGIHIPSWDSPASDQVWTDACGKDRWRLPEDPLGSLVGPVSDESLWQMRGVQRSDMVARVRTRLARQLSGRGASAEMVEDAARVLDPNILTLGFARRFTEYKRPNLLLHDQARLARLFNRADRPVQLVIAGKAHPEDLQGKRMIHDWVVAAQDPALRHRLVFLEDYDMALAQELVQGVDVWINTPRRPWEACGTSGMKVLVNGGLNLSVLDGWWEEAFQPDLGWAIEPGPDDAADARALFDRLERDVVPEFYDRDAAGIPRAWLGRVRRSMARLTPAFSSNRMLRDYLAEAYLPAALALGRRRDVDLVRSLVAWEARLRSGWSSLHLGHATVTEAEGERGVSIPVYLGTVGAEDVRVEAYADPDGDGPPAILELRQGVAIGGAENGFIFAAGVPGSRAAGDFTVRVVPRHETATVPAELPLILWAG